MRLSTSSYHTLLESIDCGQKGVDQVGIRLHCGEQIHSLITLVANIFELSPKKVVLRLDLSALVILRKDLLESEQLVSMEWGHTKPETPSLPALAHPLHVSRCRSFRGSFDTSPSGSRESLRASDLAASASREGITTARRSARPTCRYRPGRSFAVCSAQACSSQDFWRRAVSGVSSVS